MVRLRKSHQNCGVYSYTTQMTRCLFSPHMWRDTRASNVLTTLLYTFRRFQVCREFGMHLLLLFKCILSALCNTRVRLHAHVSWIAAIACRMHFVPAAVECRALVVSRPGSTTTTANSTVLRHLIGKCERAWRSAHVSRIYIRNAVVENVLGRSSAWPLVVLLCVT